MKRSRRNVLSSIWGPMVGISNFVRLFYPLCCQKTKNRSFRKDYLVLWQGMDPPQDSKIQPSVSTSSGRMAPEVREDVLGQEDY